MQKMRDNIVILEVELDIKILGVVSIMILIGRLTHFPLRRRSAL